MEVSSLEQTKARVLTINGGSSSIKFPLFDDDDCRKVTFVVKCLTRPTTYPKHDYESSEHQILQTAGTILPPTF